MKKEKKSLVLPLLFVMSTSLLTGCAAGQPGATGSQGEQGIQGEVGPQGDKGDKGDTGAAGTNGTDGQDGQTPFIGENGNWWIGTTDTGVKAEGTTGATGAQGEKGDKGDTGAAGTNGTDGQDGQTPFIGENGNWWIGTTDTGVKAEGTTGATGAQGEKGDKGDTGATGADGKDGQTPFIGENGNWWIGTTDTGVKAEGTTGATGAQGEKGDKGDTGATGADGQDGQTPFIGENGNWWIGTTDTGVKAEGTTGATGAQGEKGDKGDTGATGADGKDGQTPFIGENGNWWIGTTDTGVKAEGTTGATGAQGEKGDKGDTGAAGTNGTDGQDGQTPFIGENGNWWIGTTDTGVKAEGTTGATGAQGEKGDKGDTGATGADGQDGQTPFIGENGNWWIGTTDTGVKAEGTTGATGAQGEKGDKGDTGAAGADGQDGQTPFIGENGNWWIGTTDTGVKAEGTTGATGAQGEKGDKGDTGAAGTNGTDGQDGQTPFIGENGNWWIGTTDTGVKAEGTTGATGAQGEKGDKGDTGATGADGKDGQTPFIGENGNWWIGTTDTGVKAEGTTGATGAQGEKGDKGDTGATGADGKDGQTPFIGENGNWWIGTTDTGVKAEGTTGATGAQGEKGDKGDTGAAGTNGTDGQDGQTPFIGENGNWWIGTTDTGVKAEGTTGATGAQGEKGDKGDTGATGADGKDGQTPFIGENGNWWIGTTDTGVKAEGTTGATGAQGEKGDKGDTGAAGTNGTDGQDGQTPFIGENGNWWIGTTDTGVKAEGTTGATGAQGEKGDKGDTGATGADGKDGQTPFIGENGNWWIGTTDTGVKAEGTTGAAGAQGEKGDKGDTGAAGADGKDGQTPFIGENGNWWIGTTDTGVKAEGTTGATGAQGEKGDKGDTGAAGTNGTDGQDGQTPFIGENGNWWIGTTDTGVKAEGTTGATGAQGEKGDKGDTGATGADGQDGQTPFIGENGNWWIGTTDTGVKAEGTTGATGAQGEKGDKGDTGATGADGKDGKSAYELYLESHPDYEGDEAQWIDDLVNDRLSNKAEYTVSFDSKGGSPVESQKVEKSEKLKKPADPSQDGYTFDGWYNEYDEKWVFGGYTVTEDMTLVAKWTPIQYTITLDPNGVELLNTEINIYYGETFELPTLSRTDGEYQFNGWLDSNNELVEDTTYLYTTDETFTASWSRKYTITFDSNGGSSVKNYSSYDKIITNLPQPSYEGKVFFGWYYEDELITFPYTYEFDKDITLKAKWANASDEFSYIDDDDTISIVGYNGTKQDVNIPSSIDGKTVTTLKASTFENKKNITSVVLPSTLTTIEDGVLEGCSSLTSITFTGTKEQWNNIYNTNQEIQSSVVVTCTDGTITISGDSVGLEFELSDDNDSYNVYSIGTCTDTDVIIPASYNGLPVTSIGVEAFSGCSSLTSIKIPSSVTSIGSSAFSDCRSLTSITIPSSVTSIGNYAFNNCRSLTSITIPSSVTSIGNYAFRDCSRLTSITIPSSVTSIGDSAFSSCSSLTSITIPSSVTRIGSSAFSGCSSLTSIIVDSNNSVYDSRNNCNAIIEASTNTLILGCKNTIIPSSVTSIGDSAFIGCRSLTSITIPNSVTSIGSSAFCSCSSLTSITIPSSVTSIGERAFLNCSSLTSITIPSSVTSIGESVFASCSSLTSITIPSSVTSIGDSAFYNCNSLTSITIPSSITSIGNQAFYACSSLTSITIPSSVTSIGNYAFSCCSRLTSIIVDSNNSVYDSRNNCNAIIETSTNTLISGCKNTFIPSSVTSIGVEAFGYCSRLTSITIPSSVASIGWCAFYGCSSLTSITFTGTMEQWSNIYKDNPQIQSGVVVTCTDGTITIK